MEIEFYGAASGVTGSCHILRVGGHRVLLDCGLIQGSREEEARNREPFPFDPAAIDAVVLSHAHLDHSGRLPLLLREGFRGPIYTQNATRDLCDVLWQDAAGLEERDAAYQNRRSGGRDVLPLYTRRDAAAAFERLVGLPYRKSTEILPGIRVRLLDAGHILGSALVELDLTQDGMTRRLVYSGDIGQYDTPILNDPTTIEAADCVLMESTYGDRQHRSRDATIREIGEIIAAARHDRGNVLIPAFSIGRSQEILYLFGRHYDAWGLDRWQIFLDSPMAIEATRIYWDYPQLYDEEATRLRRRMHEMPQLQNLRLTRSVEESQAINRLHSGAIIIAGSGMCTGGRIVHHLKQNLGRRGCHVLIVGFQANGTLGRRLVNGEESVRIHGEDYRVQAQIHTVGGLSAHADQSDLLRWLKGFRSHPVVCLVHGETDAKLGLQNQARETLGIDALIPAPGDLLDLTDMSLERRSTPPSARRT
ncbi:MAG: MBL fold metallo-hydrolase [Thiocapsa sp.]|nr:MBL fold metallo-hydrolase [Thiocapsa sp.]MCG6986453.1 MBL fold metallo-hydrolase [Thiocapsa sp.]